MSDPKILTPKVIVKYLKNRKKRGVNTVWMFRSDHHHLEKIRSVGNKYSVLLKLRNHIKSTYQYDLFESQLYLCRYYIEEKDDVIYKYLNDNFFEGNAIEMIKIPKELTYI